MAYAPYGIPCGGGNGGRNILGGGPVPGGGGRKPGGGPILGGGGRKPGGGPMSHY